MASLSDDPYWRAMFNPITAVLLTLMLLVWLSVLAWHVIGLL